MDLPTEQTETNSGVFHCDETGDVEPSPAIDWPTRECVIMQTDFTDMETPKDEPPSVLPSAKNWDSHRFGKQDVLSLLEDMGLYHILHDTHSRNEEHTVVNSTIAPRRKGWQRPEPGPTKRKKNSNRKDHLRAHFRTALVHLLTDALHHEQVYYLSDVTSSNSEMLATSQRINKLQVLERENTTPSSAKRKMWSLMPQLGVPGFILKLTSSPHAIALYMLPDR